MDKLRIIVFNCYILLIGILAFYSCQATEEKVCQGTNKGLSHNDNPAVRYQAYKLTYTNCTFIAGNLEIVFLDEEDDYDLSFLSTIKEVTGYVYIGSVFASHLPLTSLRVIRGRSLYRHDDQYLSLYVALNYMPGSNKVGVRELQFKSLYEIMAGDVILYNNYNLCYANTIDWSDIIHEQGQFRYQSDNTSLNIRDCGKCDSSCPEYEDNQVNGQVQTRQHCWGAGADMCQRLTRRTCSLQCNGRCYGELPTQCCHPECVGGCTGSTDTQCWACKHFKNGDQCVPFCPRSEIYNPETFTMDVNPLARVSYGSLCLEECPEHMVVSNEACVRSCGSGYQAEADTHKCKPCDGPCPKTCLGLRDGEFVSAKNIESFRNCTIIDGSISILPNTFSGDPYFNVSALHPSNLSVFETVREVTGYIKIQGEHEHFKSMSFLRNLTTIHGRELDTYRASLHIYSSTLETLEMTSLESVEFGMIFIQLNRKLCYADNIDWRRLAGDSNQDIRVEDNGDEGTCTAEGKVCSSECTEDGCWGEGDAMCLSCQNWRMGERCVKNCSDHDGVYEVVDENGERLCAPCHPECSGGCTGELDSECVACKNVKDGPYCKPACPARKYPDASGLCQTCYEHCAEHGCTGPGVAIGPGGCNSCDFIELDQDRNITRCLDPSLEDCVKGYYKGYSKDYAGIYACHMCHPLCTSCFGDTPDNCRACLHFFEGGTCVANCSDDHYEDGNQCRRCSDMCTSCYGPSASECLSCNNFKIYYTPYAEEQKEESEQHFNCTEECPEWAPLKQVEKNEDGSAGETVCVVEIKPQGATGFVPAAKVGPILGAVFSILVLLGVVISVVAFWCSKRAKALESKERLAARMSGMCEESEITPLTPTAAKPDMAVLRLIKESTLRKGTMVGSGAFGTVYKGFWIPEGENIKIPVAIKVLQEGTTANQNRELLEEARVMASVNNRYCVPVIGVCMTAQIMLVTPYMPLGCLLDYVRKNQENIGSKVLLDWCTQIASGMAYLEERGIVHRDLAARNVLVQNPKRVRVTDFGLAKLLDYNEEEFHASGGKMPIKWLALECMQYRIFTHKSDVWSFGVTMWELFTYGQRPYENIRARDIPELLEKGERLPQPPICTIDVYMIMIKCWMLDAQSRPSFKELAEEFAKMARDPGRYLVIQGDRLMRLPSHSYDKQVFRNMSVSADGPEEIVEAEEYLQPAGDEVIGESTSPPHRHHHGRSHHHHYPNGRLEKVKEENSGPYDNERSRLSSRDDPMDHVIPVSSEPPGPTTKYASLEAAAAQRKQRETEPNRDSLKSRYSSDPCRIIAPPAFSPVLEENDFPTVPAPPTPIDKATFDLPDGNAAPDAKRKHLQVPVDEDDYLQPSSASHPKYMDLVQDDYLPPSPSTKIEMEDLPPPPPDPPGYDPIPQPTGMFAENPEYFDQMNSENDDFSESMPLTGGQNGSAFLNTPDKDRLRSISTESDGANSENDYYNDTAHFSGVPAAAKNKKNRGGAPSPGTFVNPNRTNPSVKYVV